MLMSDDHYPPTKKGEHRKAPVGHQWKGILAVTHGGPEDRRGEAFAWGWGRGEPYEAPGCAAHRGEDCGWRVLDVTGCCYLGRMLTKYGGEPGWAHASVHTQLERDQESEAWTLPQAVFWHPERRQFWLDHPGQGEAEERGYVAGGGG